MFETVVLSYVWYGNFIYTRYFLQVHLRSSIELKTNYVPN